MRFNQLITKTSKSSGHEQDSTNARLLTQAGYIRQEVAGVYSFLPLGLRVLNKIENIVREEMDTIGTELLMPQFTDKRSWQITDRLESFDALFKAVGANKPSLTLNDSEYILGSTHEEVVTPLAKHFRASYKDFPFALYQIQTKFRNEPRPRSGLLRGREFRMKDLYSFHTSQKDLDEYYDKAKRVYIKLYDRLGLGKDTFLTVAAGGAFTEQFTHEFQTLLPNGEDTIYLDRKKGVAYNQEIATPAQLKKLKVDIKKLEKIQASEVGNIFMLGDKYSKAFGYTFTDKGNKQQPVVMGCYGIGTSRIMGVIAEKFADGNGLVWPEAIAPFAVHIVVLGKAKQAAEKAYKDLAEAGVEVLLDDREDESAGVKLADADLLGIPTRVVISDATLKSNSAEVKARTELKPKLVKLSELGK